MLGRFILLVFAIVLSVAAAPVAVENAIHVAREPDFELLPKKLDGKREADADNTARALKFSKGNGPKRALKFGKGNGQKRALKFGKGNGQKRALKFGKGNGQ